MPFLTGATILSTNLVCVGSSMFNRLGRKICLKSLQIRGKIIDNVITSPSGIAQLRLMIVYDSQANGAYPAITDILNDTNYSGGNITNVTSGININNRDRFRILYDKNIVYPASYNNGTTSANLISAPYGTMSGNGEVYINKYIKLRNLETVYKADTATTPVVGDISTGNLLIITYCDGTTNQYSLQASVRLRFTD